MSAQKSGNKCVMWHFNRHVKADVVDDSWDDTGIDIDEKYKIPLNFSDDAVIFSTGVLTYLISDILDLASIRSAADNLFESEPKKPMKCRINPKNIQSAIKGDFELNELLKNLIEGFPSPFINARSQPV